MKRFSVVVALICILFGPLAIFAEDVSDPELSPDTSVETSNLEEENVGG